MTWVNILNPFVHNSKLFAEIEWVFKILLLLNQALEILIILKPKLADMIAIILNSRLAPMLYINQMTDIGMLVKVQGIPP